MRCMSQYVANKNVFSERLKLSLPTAGSLQSGVAETAADNAKKRNLNDAPNTRVTHAEAHTQFNYGSISYRNEKAY